MEAKVCSGCYVEKPLSDFYKQLGKRRSRCKTCVNRVKQRYNKTDVGKIIQRASEKKYKQSDKHWSPNTLYVRAKASAKQHNRIFLLTKEQYCELINKSCYYCNGALNNEKSRGIGLDRIDNSLGYVPGNVVRSCGFCNKTRGDRLTVEEMKKVAEFIIQLKTTNTMI